MTFMMAATMAVVMLAFMLHMLKNKKINIAIVAVSVVIFTGSLFLVRSQSTIADVSYMKAMIPHHSIAILTSERATFKDPRVQELANEIIKAQRREIDEMKKLIKDLEGED
jgi:catabolite regulation protein CreA